MGVAPDRLILEAGARDTYENADLSQGRARQLGLLGPGKRWVLITSAYHMPRAIASFRQAGLDVDAWPVDYRTRGHADLTRPSTRFQRACGGSTSRRGSGRAPRLSACWKDQRALACARGGGRRLRTSLRRKPEACQAPHVDPILEIARGAEVGAVFAAIGRHHLAEHAEARAGSGFVPIIASQARAAWSAPSRPGARREWPAAPADGVAAAARPRRARLTRCRRHWWRR